MKKLLACLFVVLAANLSAAAQDVSFHFGLDGGLSIDKFATKTELEKNGLAGWHVGATGLIKLPVYFAIQPSVRFEQGYSNVLMYGTQQAKMKTDMITVPIAVQWGPDLGICRPYLQAVPFADFIVGSQTQDAEDGSWTSVKEHIQTVQFGIGVGLGIDIWRFQVSARYNWEFGDWKAATEDNPFADMAGKRQGVTVSLAFFFN